jgi:carboxymethylenebutenolidase
MRRTWECWAAAWLVAGVTATASAGVKTMDITIPSGDEEVKGFLAEPDGKGPFPAVVVIQEWWGLNDWIKENAKRFAEQGYVALAPDLYRGKVTDNPQVAGQLLKGLPADRALRDLKGAVSLLAGRDNVNKEKIGAIGWCMGGGFALQLGLNDDRVQALVMCYGRVVTDPEKLKPLHAAVLGIFGEEDKGIPPDMVRQFEAALKQEGKNVERIHIFSGAGHGFMRPFNGPDKKNPASNEEAAKEAWKEIDAFFHKTLGARE